MGFLGRLFGTENALSSAVEGVKNGLDALVYTDQEKAEDGAKATTEARAMVVGWMRATQGQNLARRLIALGVTGIWAVQYITSMLLGIAAVWVDDAGPLIASSAVINESAQQMNGAVMLILGFYFAAPFMGDIAKGALSKFGGK